jgi:hypothetical protein
MARRDTSVKRAKTATPKSEARMIAAKRSSDWRRER